MPELIALQALKYPRPLMPGDTFTADDGTARVLTRIGKARAASGYATRKMDAEQSDDGLQPVRKKRQYQRRDMLAQE